MQCELVTADVLPRDIQVSGTVIIQAHGGLTFDFFVRLYGRTRTDLGLNQACKRLRGANLTREAETLDEDIDVGIVVEVLRVDQRRVLWIS